MSLHFPSTKLRSRKTLKFLSSNSSSKSRLQSIRSIRKNNYAKLNAAPSLTSNYDLFTSPALRQIGNTNIKDLIITLHTMGFEDERIERTLYYGEVTRFKSQNLQKQSYYNYNKTSDFKLCNSIEEAMYFLVPNKNGLWEHKFIPEEFCRGQDWCLFCKRHQEKIRE